MPLANLQTELHGSTLLARLDGELDLSNVPGLTLELATAVPNTVTVLALDLSAVTYMDSAGLGMLYALARQLRDRQQRLSVVVPEASRLRRLLAVASIASIAQIYADDATALAAS